MNQISNIQFKYATPSDIKSVAVVRVKKASDFYEGTAEPVPGGVYDLRMGSFSDYQTCLTCQSHNTCTGHYGYVDLDCHVLHCLTTTKLMKILNASCVQCRKLCWNPMQRLINWNTLKLLECHCVVEATELFQRPLAFINKEGNVKVEKLYLNWISEKNVKSVSKEQETVLNNIVDNIVKKRAKQNGYTNLKEYIEACKLRSNVMIQEQKREFEKVMLSVPQKSCPFDENSSKKLVFKIDKEQSLKLVVKYSNATLHSGLTSATEQPFYPPEGYKTALDTIVNIDELAILLGELYDNEKEIFRLLYNCETKEQFVSTFVVKTIAVSPNKFRPPSKGTVREAVSDIISVQLMRIISLNEKLVSLKEKGTSIHSGAYKEAVLNVQKYFFEMIEGNEKQSIKGIKENLSKKSGIFRNYFMGKRVNFAARSVIAPSLTVSTGEVQIPEVFAMKCSYPESVTEFNNMDLMKYIKNGPNIYPGANQIELKDGKIIDLGRVDKRQRDRYAKQVYTQVKTVWRHVQNKDYCLLNRQPTLHRPSLMSLKIRVKSGERVIRFHYANCKSYNADFDGDEMNIHFPQNELSKAEMATLTLSVNQYIDPTRGEPIRGLIQDHIVAGVILTKKDMFFNREQFVQLVYSAVHQYTNDIDVHIEHPCILKPKMLWSGKQVITSILKTLALHLNFQYPVNFDCQTKLKKDVWAPFEEEAEVIVRDNELLTGVLDKSQIGASKHGLVHACFEVFGAEYADQLLASLSRGLTKFLQVYGFTCGIDDCVLTPLGDKRRKKRLNQAYRKTIAETTKYVAGNRKVIKDDEKNEQVKKIYLSSRKKADVSGIVKRVLNNSTKDLMSDLLPKHQAKSFPSNFLSLMAESGAKGSRVNVSQICCCLGLQTFGGHLVDSNVSGRTLPSFETFDMSAMAEGYIGNRFYSGIEPQEYFFHCMAGRDGLNDTALKTAESGYLQRCLIKALEDIKVHYDYTVRDSFGTVVQFQYGGDSIDITRTSFSNYKFMAMNKGALFDKYSRILGVDLSDTIDSIQENAWSRVSEYLQNPILDVDAEERTETPETKLLKYIKENPDSVLESVDNPYKSRYQCTPEELKLLHQLSHIYSLVQPGEAVGVLAAQAVGEPSTQMTLNTFHSTGSDVVGVTQGIPRLRQILMSGHVATQVMQIPVFDHSSDENIHKTQVLLTELPFTQALSRISMREKLDSKGVAQIVTMNFDIEKLENEYFFPVSEFKKAAKILIQNIAVQMAPGTYHETTAESSFISELNAETALKSFQENDLMSPKYAPDPPLLTEEDFRNQKKWYKKQKKDGLLKKLDIKKEIKRRIQIWEGIRDAKKVVDHKREAVKKHRKTASSTILAKDDISISEDGTVEFTLTNHPSYKKALSPVIHSICKNTFLRKVPKIRLAQYIPRERTITVEGLDFDLLVNYRLCEILDINRIRSNDIYAIISKYGVEAGRALILEELHKVFSSYGQDVDVRHLSLIADYCTYSGSYKPCNKYSMKNRPGILANSTFEIPTNYITAGSLFREYDNLETPASQLIVGRSIDIGSGMIDVLF